MRTFSLNRIEDESGISGTGRVAEGVEFQNGWCALVWLTKHTSCAFYASISEVEAIHGHNGRTKIVFEPAPPMKGALAYVEEALVIARDKTPDDWAYAVLDSAVMNLRKAHPEPTDAAKDGLSELTRLTEEYGGYAKEDTAKCEEEK